MRMSKVSLALFVAALSVPAVSQATETHSDRGNRVARVRTGAGHVGRRIGQTARHIGRNVGEIARAAGRAAASPAGNVAVGTLARAVVNGSGANTPVKSAVKIAGSALVTTGGARQLVDDVHEARAVRNTHE